MKAKFSLALVTLFTLITLPLAPLASQAASWPGLEAPAGEYSGQAGVHLMGTFHVGPSPTQSIVEVPNCASNVANFMVRVSGAGITISRASFLFADGSRRDLDVTYSFPANYESNWFSSSLLGFIAQGCLRSVAVVSHTSDGRALAQMQFWAQMR